MTYVNPRSRSVQARAHAQGHTRVELDHHRAERPNVDRAVVRELEDHFRAAVEARLNVLVHRLPFRTRAAKVNHLHGAALRGAEEDILRFQVACGGEGGVSVRSHPRATASAPKTHSE